MYIKLAISYFFIIGFLFLNEAKSGFIFESDGIKERTDEEGYRTSIKIRNINVYFGDEYPENEGEGYDRKFNLNNLKNKLNQACTLLGIPLGKVSFHRVNNNEELTAMEGAIINLLSKPTDIDIEAYGNLEQNANNFILSKLTESNRRDDSSSDEN